MQIERRLPTMGCAVVLVTLSWLLLSCDDSPQKISLEICDNGVDDDYDNIIDCEDISCIGDRACSTTDGDGDSDVDSDIDGDIDADADGDGDGDSDSDSDSDGDGDGDGDSDGDGDADSDADVDSDADADIPDADEPCDPEVEPCDGTCTRDEHCELALDMMDCCGGYPHDEGGEIVLCPTAAVTTTVASDPCILSWSPSDPIPEVPSACNPLCTGVLCASCLEPVSTMCLEGVCHSMAEGECWTDDDCDEGATCVDVDMDGRDECVPGVHECSLDEDCLAIYTECDDCLCMDFDIDGLRECDCFGCGSLCFGDLDCEPQELCEGSECVYVEDSCRVERGNLDCDPCFICEISAEDPMRGTCIPDPLAEPDCE